MKKHIFFLSLLFSLSFTLAKANDLKAPNIGINLSIIKESRNYINPELFKIVGSKIINISKTTCILSLPVYENCPLGTSVLTGWIEISYNCESGSTYTFNFVPSGRPCKAPVA